MEQIAKEYQGKVDVRAMNVDVSPDTAATLGIMAIPAIVFFKDGKEVARLAGPPKARIVAEMQRVFGV